MELFVSIFYQSSDLVRSTDGVEVIIPKRASQNRARVNCTSPMTLTVTEWVALFCTTVHIVECGVYPKEERLCVARERECSLDPTEVTIKENEPGKRDEQESTMTNFSAVFAAAMLMNILFTLRSSDYYKKKFLTGSKDAVAADQEDEATRAKWQKLLRKYLAVYLLGTLSDWLQGPYVYALYADYGYSQHEIAVLFVAGFGSSMVFGSFVGGMADWGGRRSFVVLFSIVYAASCMTKRKFNFGNLCAIRQGISCAV